MRYGGKAVAEAEIVAREECPFDETRFDKFNCTAPQPAYTPYPDQYYN